jgi:hypothetical protein
MYVLYFVSSSGSIEVVERFGHLLEALGAVRAANLIDKSRDYRVDYEGEISPAEEYEFVMSHEPFGPSI